VLKVQQSVFKTIGAVLFLLSAGALATAAVTTQWVIGTASTAMLTPNSIASNGYTAASTAYDNTISGQTTGSGYTRCSFEAVLAFPANPSANAAVLVWILPSQDGTNYADAPTGSIITSPAHVAIPVTQGQNSTRQTVFTVCPPGKFKIVAQMNGTGQTTNSSGNTITLKQYTPQGN